MLASLTHARFATLLALFLAFECCPVQSQQNATEAPASQDRHLVDAISKRDAAEVGNLLADELTWTDKDGRMWNKSELLQHLPAARLTQARVPHAYGEVVYLNGSSAVGAEKIRFVRVWVKQSDGWKLLLSQETAIVGTKATVQATVPAGTACENPCKSIPYDAPNAEAQAVVASWEALEDAVNHRNADGWAAHVADEFVFNVKEDGNPLTKADRVTTIRQQAKSERVTDIGYVLPGTMKVAIFGDTAVMSDQQQPTTGGNPYQAMRIWIKRDSRWQLIYSQQTVIQKSGIAS